MVKKISCIVVLSVFAALVLFVFSLALALYGFPAKWEKYSYEPTVQNTSFVNFHTQAAVDKKFVNNFLFKIYLRGGDDDYWSGGSPYQLAIVANTNRGECRNWDVISVRVSDTNKTVTDEPFLQGRQSALDTEMTYGDAKTYEVGIWKSEQPLNLPDDDNTAIVVHIDMLVTDENNVMRSVKLQREFVSRHASGWFKARN